MWKNEDLAPSNVKKTRSSETKEIFYAIFKRPYFAPLRADDFLSDFFLIVHSHVRKIKAYPNVWNFSNFLTFAWSRSRKNLGLGSLNPKLLISFCENFSLKVRQYFYNWKSIFSYSYLRVTLRSLINVQCTLINFLKKSSLYALIKDL